ncbi:head-tail connector protein [Roseovarius sp.]
MDQLLNRTVAPASAPVSLREAKAQLRVDHSDEDEYISALIAAAAASVEEMTGQALLTQTWTLAQRYPQVRIYLPKTPVQSLTSIAYYDRDETLQTEDVADYHLFKDIYRAWVEPIESKDWPDVFDRADALTITFVAGYGAATAVPVELRHAILMLVSHWYEERRIVTEKAMREIPFAVEHLVGLHKRGWVGA